MSPSGNPGNHAPLKVAWFSYFPVERLPNPPEPLTRIPRMHPATWQRVFWEQLNDRNDIALDIIAVRGQFEDNLTFQRNNTRFHCIKTPGGLRSATLYWLDTMLIRKKLRQIKPDVVHAWGTEFGAASIATRLGYPALITMQGILTWLGDVFPLNRQMQIARFLEPRALKKAKVVSAESKFAIEYLRQRYPHLTLLQVEHAPNPIFAKVTRKPENGRVRLIALGGFQYAKGGDLVLEGLNRLCSKYDFELTWIGSVDQGFARDVQGRISPDFFKRIVFKHDLNAEQIAVEFERATFLIHASRADNSPNSVKEAVVAGIPVIGSRTGGIPDYVHEGRNGILFEPGVLDSFVAALETAMNHPLFARGIVDQPTLAWAREYLSAETMTRKFLEGYQIAMQAGR
ncbi:MAG: glycosyltransferase family 4 protein [Verrucomicrobiota bacterium]